MFSLIMEKRLVLFIGLWLTWLVYQALASVGFRCIGLPWSTDSNPKMETDRADKDRPRVQVVDWVYKSATLPHTNLEDASPIVISCV